MLSIDYFNINVKYGYLVKDQGNKKYSSCRWGIAHLNFMFAEAIALIYLTNLLYPRLRDVKELEDTDNIDATEIKK